MEICELAYLFSLANMTENTSRDECDNIVDVINWAVPGEKHIPGMRYAGPGTNLAKRLDEQGRPRPGNEPIDRVDTIALRHDLAYSQRADLAGRLAADRRMLDELKAIESPTCRERTERAIVYLFLYPKYYLGQAWLACFGGINN